MKTAAAARWELREVLVTGKMQACRGVGWHLIMSPCFFQRLCLYPQFHDRLDPLKKSNQLNLELIIRVSEI